MNLAVNPPLAPMLAKRVDDIPLDAGWLYEPKWDGFRVLVFREGDEILLQSRDLKSLNRYFPEVAETLLDSLPPQCVLDGEIVVAKGNSLDFDELQLRVHPAASRVKLLAKESPASVVFFDLLCQGANDLREAPFHKRREHLERLLAYAPARVHLTPITAEPVLAQDWFERFEGAGLDGVVAKAAESSYSPGKRTMLKIKHERDCDCVVAGFRWHKKGEGTLIGSLLLGLFDEAGTLHHVGVCASFTQDKRRELVDFLAPLREGALENHPWRLWSDPEGTDQRMPGGQSRWSQGKDLSWIPLRPELVVEVAYEHMQGPRFRHMSQFRRWRTDKAPSECTYAQLDVVPPHELATIFAAAR